VAEMLPIRIIVMLDERLQDKRRRERPRFTGPGHRIARITPAARRTE